MKHLSLLVFLFLVGCSEGIVGQFRDCCATHDDPGFEEKLAQLVPVGGRKSDFEDLLEIADKKSSDQFSTTYVFSYATGAYAEQGLVVMISVDQATERITAVKSAIAAN